MNRRDFLSGAMLLHSAICARAETAAKVYRIAIVHPSYPIAVFTEMGWFRALLEELRRLGYSEGQNLRVERYSGEGRTDHYAELARDVVRSEPDVVFAISVRMVRHFKEATTTLPIIGSMASPVDAGLVTSIARPGANITGISVDAGLELLAKRLELLREVVPAAARVAFLAPRAAWEGTDGRAMREAARPFGVTLLGQPLDDPIREPGYRRAFKLMAQEGVNAVIVGDHPENTAHRRVIVELAKSISLPAIYAYRDYLELGGLITYGVDLADFYRRVAPYVDHILKGAKPGELPVYQADKFELGINLRTARTLGLIFPPALLARADEVIE